MTDYQPTAPGSDDEASKDDVSGEGVDDETATLDEVEPPPGGSRADPPAGGGGGAFGQRKD